MVLLAVAALVIADQTIVQPLLVRMNSYAPAINLAGRQRMLSQRLTKSALAMQVCPDEASRQRYREELRTTLAQWSSAHGTLHQKDSQLGLGDPRFDAFWIELEPHFAAMVAAGNELVGQTNDAPVGNAALAVSTIVDHEAAFLRAMEQIVLLLEQDADRQVARLRIVALSIAAAIMVLLLGLGRYVVRPANRVIRGQVDRLESQVDSRTRQLALANESLRKEMTERQDAESKSRVLAAQLAHAARISTMGQLTAALAHEINQPLATIANDAATCELNLAGCDAPADRKLLGQIEHIKQAALRAGQIVRRIRNFVQPGLQSPAVQADLNELVQEVVELCRFEAEHDAIEVVLQLTADKTTVLADSIQIQQVLVNLLQNAMQALRGSPQDMRRVQIQTSAADGNVVACVHDWGPGLRLDPDLLFIPFSTTKPEGLGIGLSICRSILESHDGRIWADRAVTCGTKICFSLPQVAPPNAGRSEQLDCVCR